MRFSSLISSPIFFLAAVSFEKSFAAPFFQPSPSAESKLIYLSESGSDLNDCSQSMPCKTLSYGMSLMRRGQPDHLYLETGGTWDLDEIGSRDVPSGSLGAPAVLGYYGDGPRPVVEVSGVAWDRLPLSNVVFSGWNFTGKNRNPYESDYAAGRGAGLTIIYASDNLRFDDVKFSYVELTIIPQTYTGGPETARNLMINRSIFLGAHENGSSNSRDKKSSNLFVMSTEGVVVEESVFDFGGWHPEAEAAGANAFNHCFYGQYKNPGNHVLVKGNIFSRCSSHGLQVRWGGLVEDNFFARNSIAVALGYQVTSSPVSPENTRHYLFDNVITEISSQYRGDNPCQVGGLCTKAAWGIQTETAIAGEGSEFIIRGNLVGGYNFEADSGIERSDLYKRPIDNNEGAIYQNNLVDEQLLTLSDYASALGYQGNNLYDEFMLAAVNRPVGNWSSDLSATSINHYIRTGGEELQNSSTNLIANSSFSEAELFDMPSVFTVGFDPSGEWFARVGTTNQSSQLLHLNGNTFLDAGAGTTNGAFQVIENVGSGTYTLTYDYIGSPILEILSATSGDTISKYNDSHSLDLISTITPQTTSTWLTSQMSEVVLGSSYDHIVVRVRYGDVDNVSFSSVDVSEDVLTEDFSSSALHDMPSVLEVSEEATGKWYSRVGTCGQCSELIENAGERFIVAAGGTSNGAFHIVPWFSPNGYLSFDYRGSSSRLRIYGANVGDSINKWDNNNSMSLLLDESLPQTGIWESASVEVIPNQSYDFFVIQLYNGDFDNIELSY